MKATTLNKLKDKHPCTGGWTKLLKHINKTKPDDEALPFSVILKSNGINDAVWCLRTLSYREQCLFCRDVALLSLPLFEKKFPKDKRPREAIEAIQKFYDGEITEEELKVFSKAADTAADAADAAAREAAAAAAAAREAAAADTDAAAYAAYDAYAAYASYDAYAAYASYAAAYAAYDATTVWTEIEELFIKHFVDLR